VRCFWLFWQFATLLVTQDLHKSHNGMIFSNKARLLLDFSRVIPKCKSVWNNVENKTQLIYIFVWIRELPCHVRQAWCHARRRRHDFQDKLFSSGSNITELIFVTSYASYYIQNICPWKNNQFIIESHKIKFQSIELQRNIWEWASERTVLYYFVCPTFTLLSDILQILSHFVLVLS